MKSYIKFLAISTVCFFFTSCKNDGNFNDKQYSIDQTQSAVLFTSAEVTLDHALITRTKSHAFIPVFLSVTNSNTGSTASQFPLLILNILAEFEKDYPNLKVTTWKLQERNNSTMLEGIWIDYDVISDSKSQKSSSKSFSF